MWTQVMGDAEEAQTNAYQDVQEFKRAQVLMCFFHVLYNVRKKTRHFSTRLRKKVMTALMDMHFAASEEEYEILRDQALIDWKSHATLRTFAAYFEKQWLRGTYKRRQAYHTPTGFATTNNPCEVFNASVKRFFQRRRWYMQKLLTKLCELVTITHPVSPVSSDYVVIPTTDVKEAARLMIVARRVFVQETGVEDCVRVRHIPSAQTTQLQDHTASDDASGDEGYDAQFTEVFDSIVGERDGDDNEAVIDSEVHAEIPLDARLVARNDWYAEVEAEKEKERAAKLYNGAVKWALKTSHCRDMPVAGWTVNLKQSACHCKYFTKFTICAHIVVARSARGLGSIGEKHLTSQIKGRTAKARSKALKKFKKTSSRARVRVEKPVVEAVHRTVAPPIELPRSTTLDVTATNEDTFLEELLSGDFLDELVVPISNRGRPRLASSALSLDYILDN